MPSSPTLMPRSCASSRLIAVATIALPMIVLRSASSSSVTSATAPAIVTMKSTRNGEPSRLTGALSMNAGTRSGSGPHCSSATFRSTTDMPSVVSTHPKLRARVSGAIAMRSTPNPRMAVAMMISGSAAIAENPCTTSRLNAISPPQLTMSPCARLKTRVAR